MNTDDVVAVVTGGASGLGAATAEIIVAGGGRVAILDLASSDGAATAARLGDAAVFCAVDVADPVQVEATFADLVERIGRPNVVVNAAGTAGLHRLIADDGELFPLEIFRQTVRVNLTGTFDVLRRGAAAMRDNPPDADGGRGVIVNVSSIAALDGSLGHVGYSASKGGVVSMTLPLARELAPHGIRVMTICPGTFKTGMTPEDPARVATLTSGCVFPKRMGRSEEFAHLVREVITNPMLNGEVIRLDAGARLDWTRTG